MGESAYIGEEDEAAASTTRPADWRHDGASWYCLRFRSPTHCGRAELGGNSGERLEWRRRRDAVACGHAEDHVECEEEGRGKRGFDGVADTGGSKRREEDRVFMSARDASRAHDGGSNVPQGTVSQHVQREGRSESLSGRHQPLSEESVQVCSCAHTWLQ